MNKRFTSSYSYQYIFINYITCICTYFLSIWGNINSDLLMVCYSKNRLAQKLSRAGWTGTTSKRLVRRIQERLAEAQSDSAGMWLFGYCYNDSTSQGGASLLSLFSIFFPSNILFYFILFFIFIVTRLQLSAFSPHPSAPPQPNPPPSPASILHLGFVHVFLKTPLLTSRSTLPSDYCQIVLNFNVSSYVCFASFFVDYVPVKGEIIWYLSLTTWIISLSIMLSNSIHTIAKGISYFFLCCVEFHCVNVPLFLDPHIC